MTNYLLVFCFLFSQYLVGQLPDSRLFVPESGGFTILVPGGLMKYSSREVETEVGPLAYHSYAVDFTTENEKYFAFILSYTDYPEEGMHSDSSELLRDFFDVAVDESKFLMRGTLIYEAEENYLSYPGHIWRINYRNDSASIRNKSIMIGNRYYLLQVISDADVSSGDIAQDYLDSFKLLQ